MPYLASRVPRSWQVVHVDEEAGEIDWNIDVDVVGITFHTPSAFHAYGIAARFRSRGVCVAMGGPHVTLLPGESGENADVIFIGEAEGLWEEFLSMSKRLSRSAVQLWWTLPLNLAYGYQWRKRRPSAG